MTQPIHISMERNKWHGCKAQGCTNLRHNLSAYCKGHYQKAYQYGDPNGKALLRREYRQEIDQVTELINRNKSHISVTTALEIIQNWLNAPTKGKASVLGIEALRLLSAGVTALDILIEATAVYMYSQRRPGNLPDDSRLDYQMGVVIFRLAPRPTYRTHNGVRASRRPTGSDRRKLGVYLRQSVGVFMLNAWSFINHQEQEAQKVKERLWTSFHPETTRSDS